MHTSGRGGTYLYGVVQGLYQLKLEFHSTSNLALYSKPRTKLYGMVWQTMGRKLFQSFYQISKSPKRAFSLEEALFGGRTALLNGAHVKRNKTVGLAHKIQIKHRPLCLLYRSVM